MLIKSKNQIPIWIDWEHLQSHFDASLSGGTFAFSMDEAKQKFTTWIAKITIPPETPKSFWGDPCPPASPFTYRFVLEESEIVGWHSLYELKSLPDGTKVDWEIRRGYLTKVFPNIPPQQCKTVAFVFSHFDQEQWRKKISSEVQSGKYDSTQQHPHWKFAVAPSEWVLITSFPGCLAPPQNDKKFWEQHGFATATLA